MRAVVQLGKLEVFEGTPPDRLYDVQRQSNLGFGLPGARRLVDEFEIESKAGTGTTITWTVAECTVPSVSTNVRIW